MGISVEPFEILPPTQVLGNYDLPAVNTNGYDAACLTLTVANKVATFWIWQLWVWDGTAWRNSNLLTSAAFVDETRRWFIGLPGMTPTVTPANASDIKLPPRWRVRFALTGTSATISARCIPLNGFEV